MDEFYEELYKVFIKVNDKNEVVEVNSSAFLTDTDGWIEVDVGAGDKYHHAQNHYFPESIHYESTGAPRYKWNGTNVEVQPDVEVLVSEPTISTPSVQKMYSDIQYISMMTGISLE